MPASSSSSLISGLHHVTAMASDTRQNVDFYAGILGLRLVKKTVNFDAPEVYHLYYGDETGAPGTIMTFFPYPGLPQGRHGKGQLTVTSFSIPENSLDYWMRRLERFGVAYQEPQERFPGEAFIYFYDNDGLGIELVTAKNDPRPGFSQGQIPPEHAVRGFYGVSLSEEGYERTAAVLLDQLDHKLIAERANRFRFSASDRVGDFVDVVCEPDSLRGLGGNGTVHHLAFATADDRTQLAVREKLLQRGLNVTPVLDRQYFHSIYFREPGGVLFEVATSDIGFTLDEPRERLGETLRLPPWEESRRPSIEQALTPIALDIDQFRD